MDHGDTAPIYNIRISQSDSNRGHHMHTKSTRQAILIGLLLTLPLSASAADTPLPNVLLILADDLGYGDLSCYNPDRGRLHTPHVDRLAAAGIRFTDAHSSSGVCSPSRYTLLTGRYHWRSRLQTGIVGYLERPLIDRDRLTLASLLAAHGYHTACIGKWHLGWNWNVPADEKQLFAPGRRNFPDVTDRHRAAWQRVYSEPIAGGPTARGFHRYFGTDVPNWPPYCFIDDDRTVGIPTTFLPADQFQNNLASLPGPALADWQLKGVLPALADHAVDYIAQQSNTDAPFFLYLPLTSPHTPLAVNDSWQGRSGLDSAVADLILETDAAVGRVLTALDDHGLRENTLVIFTSDNGFAPYVGAKHLEAQGHYPSGPLRGYKGDAWEGGHRVPFIVRWPGHAPADSVCEQLVHHADVLATVAAVVAADLPPDAAEDSFNLLSLFQDPSAETDAPIRPHAISHGSRGLAALRQGNWKFIPGPGGGGPWSGQSENKSDTHPAQLYDLAADLAESNNLYADRSEVVDRLMKLMAEVVDRGRSTPGPTQQNDVPVRWQRFLTPTTQP